MSRSRRRTTSLAPMTPEIWAAMIGAAVAGAIALSSQLISAKQSRSASQDDERAARLGEFMSATHAAVLVLGELAYLPDRDHNAAKEAFRGGSAMQAARDRVNAVLNAIELLENEDVVREVMGLDRSLVRLEDEALGACWTRDTWRKRRSEVMGETVDAVYAAGRSALKRNAIDRASLWSSADSAALSRVGKSPVGAQRPPYGT